jgi:hypothetical protein
MLLKHHDEIKGFFSSLNISGSQVDKERRGKELVNSDIGFCECVKCTRSDCTRCQCCVQCDCCFMPAR